MIYLDSASTMPLREGVSADLAQYLQSYWGNVSGAHQIARSSKSFLEESREKLSDLLGVKPDNVVFTSGATESLNLVIQGFASAHRSSTFFYSAIEHAAVIKSAQHLRKLGRHVVEVHVDSQGVIKQEQLDLVSKGDLVCIMPVNNETGVINDVETIAEIVHKKQALLLLDCVQSFYSFDPKRACKIADYVVFSGHKIGSPKGVGVLIIKDRKTIEPIMYGGSQEWELRPGTTPAYLIGSFVDVFINAYESREQEASYLGGLKQYCTDLVKSTVPTSQIHSSETKTSPHILSIDIEGIESQMLVDLLDKNGVCVSKGSACASGATTPSHVLLAMGINEHRATSTIRLSFSHHNTKEEINTAVKQIEHCVNQLSELSKV